MKMEIIQRDPNYGRANQIPMTHPKLARLDSNPPEEWYLSVRLPVRIGRDLVHCTLPQLAERENEAARPTWSNHVFAKHKATAADWARLEARRERVFAHVTREWQRTREIADAAGLRLEPTGVDLTQLQRAGRVEVGMAKNSRTWRLPND